MRQTLLDARHADGRRGLQVGPISFRLGRQAFPPVPVQSAMACNGHVVLMQVLRAAGIEYPRAIAVVFSARQGSVNAVKHLHEAYPDVGPAADHLVVLEYVS